MSDWIVELGFEAQKDLSTFPWDRTNEVGGVVTGRFECSGFARRDTGRHLFVRRILASDQGGTPEAVSIDYDSVAGLQTFPVRKWGVLVGQRHRAAGVLRRMVLIHSHPGIDRQRELSDTDIRDRGSERAQRSPRLQGLAGKPFLSMLATAGEAWREGMPHEDWDEPQLDYHLIFADEGSSGRASVT